MSKTDILVKELDALPKKKKKNRKFFKTVFTYTKVVALSLVEAVVLTIKSTPAISEFVYNATAVSGGYVFVQQGSDIMRVVGAILIAGGSLKLAFGYVTGKTIRK